jgi:hypothetical protein
LSNTKISLIKAKDDITIAEPTKSALAFFKLCRLREYPVVIPITETNMSVPKDERVCILSFKTWRSIVSFITSFTVIIYPNKTAQELFEIIGMYPHEGVNDINFV